MQPTMAPVPEKTYIEEHFRSLCGEEIVCVGANVHSLMTFVYDPNDKSVVATVHLQRHNSVWKRLAVAFGYVTNLWFYREGAYQHFALDKSDIPRFRGLLRNAE